MSDAPTTAIGAVDPFATSQAVAPWDLLENVPDLQPGLLSVLTYAKMRRDARLAAVESGYGLQIRRATWQVDPAGCRPEVAQWVADDLGLPVMGADKTGAGRTRGVLWTDHLRQALLCLPFGNAAFELLAEVDGGQAHLIALSPRPAHTIEQIHGDPQTGDLVGITQDQPRKDGQPQITADRLAMYVNARETSWYGTSLFRPCYAPWYLKHELMRVHATACRRWGMGVPTVEWANGTTPTPQQMADAQRVAASARAGEQSGAAMPPGASLILRGLSGGMPDTLAYIRYLDQQMAGAALMPHLELGTTSHGARSLGETFLDSWMLALGAVADTIADTATSMIAARIVAWNWGPDEPVPRVVVSGVGSQRDVTAEALQLLLASGALSPDPALEAWVRREYQLPERTGPFEPTPLAKAQQTKPAQPLPQPAADGTIDEVAAAASDQAGESPDQQDHDAAVAALVAALPALAAPIVAAFAAAAVTGAALGGGSALTRLALGADGEAAVNALAQRIGDRLVAVAGRSADRAVREAKALGAQVTSTVDEPGVRDQAQAAAHLIADGLSQAATRAALLRPASDPAAVGDAVTSALDEQVSAQTGWVARTIADALTTVQHDARMDVLDQLHEQLGDKVEWRASEANDRNTCSPCSKVDKHVFSTYAEAKGAYPGGRFELCAGKSRCRGQLVPQPSGKGGT